VRCQDFDGKLYVENSIYHDQIEICLHLALLYIDRTGSIPILRAIRPSDEEVIGWVRVKDGRIIESNGIPRNVKTPIKDGVYFLIKKGSTLIFEPYELFLMQK
jgi:uncharacterized protein with PhoU and TrkA domain